MRAALEFEAAELIPIPVDEAVLDFTILESDKPASSTAGCHHRSLRPQGEWHPWQSAVHLPGLSDSRIVKSSTARQPDRDEIRRLELERGAHFSLRHPQHIGLTTITLWLDTPTTTRLLVKPTDDQKVLDGSGNGVDIDNLAIDHCAAANVTCRNV